MSKLDCGHKSERSFNTCKHVFERTIEDADGCVTHFTGKGTNSILLCNVCANNKIFEIKTVCESCVEEIKELTYWLIDGKPSIVEDLQKFIFSDRTVQFDIFLNVKILAYAALKNDSNEALFFTSKGDLYLLDIIQSSYKHIVQYKNTDINLSDNVNLDISNDSKLAYLTTRSQSHETGVFNSGIVIDMTSGKILMKLNNGDYHTENTDFPVTFVEYKGKTLVVHSTDWNRLDITDPYTGQCLTKRDYENIPSYVTDSDIQHTEWDGQLLISPNQERVATIGWVWHPVGTAYSWNIKNVLDGSIWEYEAGQSKKNYAMWSYFWHSPFLWLDNKRLCIWGFDELHTEEDIPLDSVAIYDSETSHLISWFAGPTIDVFYFDQYLFSGNKSGDGLTIWSVDEGTLLHEEIGVEVMAYHPNTKEFLTYQDDGNIKFTSCEKESDV